MDGITCAQKNAVQTNKRTIDSLNSINNNVSFYDDEKRKRSSRIAFYHEIFNLACGEEKKQQQSTDKTEKTVLAFSSATTKIFLFCLNSHWHGWSRRLKHNNYLISATSERIREKLSIKMRIQFGELLITLLCAIIVWMVLSLPWLWKRQNRNQYHQKIIFGKSFQFKMCLVLR